MRALPNVRWCALVGVALFACAPTSDGAYGGEATTAVPEPTVPREVDAGCGPLGIAPRGPWRTDHPLLSPLRFGWHPRAEYGRPIAVRDAAPPWPVPGHTFVQVQLAGVPREVEACFVPDAEPVADSSEGLPDRRECGVLWQMLRESPVDTWARTENDWARLVATLDGASGVFAGPDALAQCDDAPPIRNWTPGLRGTVGAPELTFVERIDSARSTTWLRVDLGHRHGNLDIVRQEIATVVRTPSETPQPEPEPTWESDWPLSDDPIGARLGVRMPRVHPLWRTPVSDACPAVMFSSLTPDFEVGPTFSRVHDRLARISGSRLAVKATEMMFVHDRLALAGLRLVAAMDSSSSCMMGWSHTHCFASDDAAWCPDGTTADLQAIVDRYELTASSLSDAQWFELAMIMSGTSTFVLEPALLAECTHVAGARARAPAVRRGWNSVTVEFTAIEDGAGTHHSIAIADGRVSATTTPAWSGPKPGSLYGLE